MLVGSAYEVGRQQGEWLAGKPELARFSSSPLPERGPITPKQAEATLKIFRQHCPGLNEEIEGFAAALGVAPEQVVYYAITYSPVGQCSHFVVLPSSSADGHLRVGRSYELNQNMSDLRLVTVRISGRPAHIGFSEILFGRDDGLNEHGLCATMSAGAPMAPTEPGGLMYWAVLRTILDRCAEVDEAIETALSMPISFNFNLLLADRSGKAAVVEIACSHRAVHRIGPETPDQSLVATNHYNLPEMKPYDLGRMWNSLVRYRMIKSRLKAAAPRVSCETLRTILSEPYPYGTCCHHYTDYLGTLWAGIYDVTAGTLEACFGAPTHNPWHLFDLGAGPGVTEYAVQLPDEASDPALFRKLAPGAEE
jgi:predicted choloylglycine hydrolase